METTRNIAFEGSPRKTPVRLWQFNGHRLMTHKAPYANGILLPAAYRVSEETTGYGIPKSWGDTEAEEEEACRKILAEKGDQLPRLIKALPVLNADCRHEHLDMDGVCRGCGQGGAPSRR